MLTCILLQVVVEPGFHSANEGAVRRGEHWVHSDHLPMVCELELDDLTTMFNEFIARL